MESESFPRRASGHALVWVLLGYPLLGAIIGGIIAAVLMRWPDAFAFGVPLGALVGGAMGPFVYLAFRKRAHPLFLAGCIFLASLLPGIPVAWAADSPVPPLLAAVTGTVLTLVLLRARRPRQP